MHELGGHLLIACMGGGHARTPRGDPFLPDLGDDEVGESGRCLETFLFGGDSVILEDEYRKGNQVRATEAQSPQA